MRLVTPDKYDIWPIDMEVFKEVFKEKIAGDTSQGQPILDENKKT